MLGKGMRWFRVSLRLSGDDLDPDEVTNRLGVEPDDVGRKGEHIGGNPKYALYATTIWVQEYSADNFGPFRDYLSGFLTQLETRAAALRELATRPGITAELFVGYAAKDGQGGFSLPASLLSRIAALGLEMELDLYPPTIDEKLGRGDT